jgi:phenylalanyl-tRNA synthetase alpha chain
MKKEWIDISLPGKKEAKGHLHPLTLLRNQVESIFARMGFAVAEGPEVEDEWHNFDALNIPQNHPARDLWDTFWLRGSHQIKNEKLKTKNERLLLRTHTSPVQIRYMQEHQSPFRLIAPGRVFRHEATDASHGFQLHQVEGLMVGEDVSVANFKAIITEFYRQLFHKEVSIRLRPSFFPFVEPGFEVDMSCVICDKKGCSTCSHSGWLEMMGAGMVHPNVFKNIGYNPAHVQGFAFGMGLDRLAMMRYKIPDMRMLFSMDRRFLEQF